MIRVQTSADACVFRQGISCIYLRISLQTNYVSRGNGFLVCIPFDILCAIDTRTKARVLLEHHRYQCKKKMRMLIKLYLHYQSMKHLCKMASTTFWTTMVINWLFHVLTFTSEAKIERNSSMK